MISFSKPVFSLVRWTSVGFSAYADTICIPEQHNPPDKSRIKLRGNEPGPNLYWRKLAV